MEKLKISKETAMKLYPESPQWFQEILTETFGSETFAPKEYTDIKTFDDACRACGTTEEEFNKRMKDLGLSCDTLHYEKAKMVVAAVNQDWTPDWNNTNQRKYWPYFNLSSGFGFSGASFVFGRSASTVGSRLCYETEGKCKYAATQFLNIYKDFFTK